jgi:hypothetical protein
LNDGQIEFNNFATDVFKSQGAINESTTEHLIMIDEAIKSQGIINELTSEQFDVINETFENQWNINETNQEILAKLGTAIRWILISNVVLFIALAVLLFK